MKKVLWLVALLVSLTVGCGRPPPNINGKWKVWIHEANAPPPIFSYGYRFEFNSSDGETLTGTAHYPLDTGSVSGYLNAEDQSATFRVVSKTYVTNVFDLVLVKPNLLVGRVFCGGFQFGSVKADLMEAPEISVPDRISDGDGDVYDGPEPAFCKSLP
jgi:hypothetical protein